MKSIDEKLASMDTIPENLTEAEEVIKEALAQSVHAMAEAHLAKAKSSLKMVASILNHSVDNKHDQHMRRLSKKMLRDVETLTVLLRSK